MQQRDVKLQKNSQPLRKVRKPQGVSFLTHCVDDMNTTLICNNGQNDI